MELRWQVSPADTRHHLVVEEVAVLVIPLLPLVVEVLALEDLVQQQELEYPVKEIMEIVLLLMAVVEVEELELVIYL